MQAQPTDQELKELTSQVLQKLKQLENSPDWIKNGDKPCDKFKIFIGERVASKGIANVNFSISTVLKFLDQEDSLKKLNNQLLSIQVLYEIKDVLRVNHMVYAGMWPVAGRDFVNVSAKFIESPTKIYIGTTACPYKHPEVKDVVRGEVFVGGYILEAIDEKSTRVTYISDADLKGSIFDAIKNKLSERQAELASRIEKCMAQQKW